MTTEEQASRTPTATPTPIAILLGVGLAALWLVLGLWRPTTTYHLAPLLVGATPAVFAAGSVTRRSGLILGASGLALALATFAVLAVAPGLDGPTIGPFASATQETIVLSLIGGVGGAMYAAFAPQRS